MTLPEVRPTVPAGCRKSWMAASAFAARRSRNFPAFGQWAQGRVIGTTGSGVKPARLAMALRSGTATAWEPTRSALETVNRMKAGRGIVPSERTANERRRTGQRHSVLQPGWRCPSRRRKAYRPWKHPAPPPDLYGLLGASRNGATPKPASPALSHCLVERVKRYSSAICPFSQRAMVAMVVPSFIKPVTAVQSPAPMRMGCASILESGFCPMTSLAQAW